MSISCIPVEFWVWKFRISSDFNDRIYLYYRCKRGLRTRQGVSKKCRFQSAAKFRSWQKYMGPVLFLCGSLLLEMQKKSAICISHFGDTYFFLLLMLTHTTTVLSSCLVCCNKFKVLNAWDSVFGTSNYIEMRVWAYTVLYFLLQNGKNSNCDIGHTYSQKDSLLQPAAPRRLRRCTLGCSMNMDILIGIFVKVVIKSLATY